MLNHNDVELVSEAITAVENGPDVGMAFEALPELNNHLEGKIKEAAKKLDFEEAADLRNRINNLK